MASPKPIPTLSEPQQHDFWERVRIDMVDGDACWPWVGSRMRRGYGRVKLEGHFYLAHRVAFTLVKGPISEGLTLDHLCRTHVCCNPAHLEPVLHKENVLRGVSPTAINARQSQCKNGHDFTPENTMVTTAGRRVCRICRRAYSKAHRYFK